MKLWVGFFLSVLISSSVLSSIAAATEDCSPIDVRDNMPAALKERFMTPYEQGNIGWCFAYAATDMLSQATGESLSALYTSAYYDASLNGIERWGRHVFFSSKSNIDEGGQINDAIHEMQKLGRYCPESSIHSQGYYIDSLMKDLESYRQGQCDAVCDASLNQLLTAYIPGSDPQAMKSYVMTNKNKSLDDLFFFILDKACSSPQKFAKKYSITSYARTSSKRDSYNPPLSDRIDTALEQGSIVGISYHAHYITDAAPKSVFADGHASSVMGRQMINNVCHYLVRNSWGDSCNYRSDIICVQGQGAYWVSKDKLNVMTDAVFSIAK